MLDTINIKLILGVIAAILTVIGYTPYLKDMFAKKTKPHLYTWLIWGITQGVATVALISGGGGFGSLSLMTGTFFVFIIFGLSFTFGTKNITKSDTLTLAIALLAILVWILLDSPLLALFMVTGIDAIGYIPTIRKSFHEPWTETLSFWLIMLLVSLLTMFSNTEYNTLTMLYLIMLSTANFVMSTLLIVRRRTLKSEVHI